MSRLVRVFLGDGSEPRTISLQDGMQIPDAIAQACDEQGIPRWDWERYEMVPAFQVRNDKQVFIRPSPEIEYNVILWPDGTLSVDCSYISQRIEVTQLGPGLVRLEVVEGRR